MNNQFICSVRYTKTEENGALKRVKEDFLVQEFTFSAAEESIYTQLAEQIRGGEFSVDAIKRVNFSDIFIYDDEVQDFFEVRVKYEGLDDDSAKAKKITQDFLVTATSVSHAISRVSAEIKVYAVDPEIVHGKVSKVMDVFDPMPIRAVKKEEAVEA